MAIERTSLDYQTLRNYAWVARKFSISRRRDTLSFGHHAEVAALPEPEQDFWLRKAEELGWSRNQIRREVRASLRERAGRPHIVEPPDTKVLTKRSDSDCAEINLAVTVTLEQLQAWKLAANSEGIELNAWAARVLDWAARHGSAEH
jgi:hypothetical protein